MNRRSLLTKAKKLIRRLYGEDFLLAKSIFVNEGELSEKGCELLRELYPRKEILVKNCSDAYTITFLEPYIYTYLSNYFNNSSVELSKKPLFAFFIKEEIEYLFRCTVNLEISKDQERAFKFVELMEKPYPDVKRSIYKSVAFVENRRWVKQF